MYQKNRCHANFFSLKIAVWIFLFSLILPVTAAEEEGLSYEVIIDPQHEDADSFSQGLAAVKKDGKWGYIDMEDSTVIPFQFDYAFSFSEGLAVVGTPGEYPTYDGATAPVYFWSVLDKQGKTVIPFEYTRITSYSNGLAVAVKDGRAFCVDRYGKEVPGSDTISQESYFPAGLESSLTMTPDEIITVIENGKYGFVRIGYTQPLPQEGEMADWAYEE